MKTKKRDSNFGAAVYISQTQGNNVPDEKIIEVAKEIGMYPKVLLRNYKTISKMNKIFKSI